MTFHVYKNANGTNIRTNMKRIHMHTEAFSITHWQAWFVRPVWTTVIRHINRHIYTKHLTVCRHKHYDLMIQVGIFMIVVAAYCVVYFLLRIKVTTYTRTHGRRARISPSSIENIRRSSITASYWQHDTSCEYCVHKYVCVCVQMYIGYVVTDCAPLLYILCTARTEYLNLVWLCVES